MVLAAARRGGRVRRANAVGYALSGDIDGLRAELRGLGAGGVAILAVLILVHAVVLFPAEIVNTAAGLLYGFGAALPLVMAAWTVSLLLAYALGAVAGRPLALRLAGPRRVELAERVVARGGVPALVLARLVPFVPMEPRRLRRRGGARPALALHVDDGRRDPADHRRRHLPRARARRLLPVAIRSSGPQPASSPSSWRRRSWAPGTSGARRARCRPVLRGEAGR